MSKKYTVALSIVEVETISIAKNYDQPAHDKYKSIVLLDVKFDASTLQNVKMVASSMIETITNASDT